MNYTFIESVEDLNYLNKELLIKEELGIDTEFRRRSKDDMRLCLLQIRDKDEIYLIDCLKINGKELDCNFFSSGKVTKIFHSYREDIEAISSWIKDEIVNVFDTQIANAMLGGSFSISYKALVEDLLGVKISKTETRSNWMRRPLSIAQLDYAASDVEFLIELYSIQKRKLLETNKFHFLKEETQFLSSLKEEIDISDRTLIQKLSKIEERNLFLKFDKIIKEISKQENVNPTLLLSKRNQKDFYTKVLSKGIELTLKEFPNWKRNLLIKDIYELFDGIAK